MVVSGVGKVLAVGPKASGISGFAGFLSSLGVPLPTLAAWGVGLLELVGGTLILLGLLVRVVGVLLAVNMLTATLLAHLPNGYADSELTFALALIALALVATGPGVLSLERAIFERELLVSKSEQTTRTN